MFGIRKHTVKRRSLTALCVAYVFFCLSPHFGITSHVHAGGDHPHHHVAASTHDVALERALFSALPALPVKASPQMEIANREAPSPSCAHVEAGAQGLRTKTGRHSHGQEDPNLLALGSIALNVQLVFAPLPRLEAPVTVVTERAPLWASARAPPVRYI